MTRRRVTQTISKGKQHLGLSIKTIEVNELRPCMCGRRGVASRLVRSSLDKAGWVRARIIICLQYYLTKKLNTIFYLINGLML